MDGWIIYTFTQSAMFCQLTFQHLASLTTLLSGCIMCLTSYSGVCMFCFVFFQKWQPSCTTVTFLRLCIIESALMAMAGFGAVN